MGFIGPNGSGKTTTLRMMMNILLPDSGRINLFAQPISHEATDRVGYMPEERGIYTRMKLREVLLFYARLKRTADAGRRVDQWLKKFDLTPWANKKVAVLSKGMSQKAQFIAAVVSQPEIIILDEPFTGLDPVNQEVMKDALIDLQSRGATIIFSTHDMSVAENLCDYILMIFQGRKVLDGTLASIQDQYGDDTLRLRVEDGADKLAHLPGIAKLTDLGQIQELRMAPGCDPHQVLTDIIQRTRVMSFEIVKPSLHDIFIRIAGAEAREANHD
ncbi:MAG: ATP-binding cassette domain-containing protein [Calditrichaeota bacterium]|nr:MAG: ATP-binding cassette domain-containing protein [Calditrichota bacterium]